MVNFTSNTYQMKREILSFSNKISRLDKRFTADMAYGMLASKNCLLIDIIDMLHKKIFTSCWFMAFLNHISMRLETIRFYYIGKRKKSRTCYRMQKKASEIPSTLS